MIYSSLSLNFYVDFYSFQSKKESDEYYYDYDGQLLKAIQPVMDMQEKPIIDLQWLFNFVMNMEFIEVFLNSTNFH